MSARRYPAAATPAGSLGKPQTSVWANGAQCAAPDAILTQSCIIGQVDLFAGMFSSVSQDGPVPTPGTSVWQVRCAISCIGPAIASAPMATDKEVTDPTAIISAIKIETKTPKRL